LTSRLEKLGDSHIAAGSHAQALECFDRALEMDPFRESSYRGLMRVRAAQGERAELLATYDRCRKMLSAHFGCRPAAETEALLRAPGQSATLRLSGGPGTRRAL
jgi:DNA-binding SARP family transcriptional activator